MYSIGIVQILYEELNVYRKSRSVASTEPNLGAECGTW